jgi:hypothetical protein
MYMDSIPGLLCCESDNYPLKRNVSDFCIVMSDLNICMLRTYIALKPALFHKHNRSEIVAVLGPFEALPYYIHTLFHAFAALVYDKRCLKFFHFHWSFNYGLLSKHHIRIQRTGAAVLQPRIRKVLGSNLGRKIGYPELGFPLFYSVPPG